MKAGFIIKTGFCMLYLFVPIIIMIPYKTEAFPCMHAVFFSP